MHSSGQLKEKEPEEQHLLNSMLNSARGAAATGDVPGMLEAIKRGSAMNKDRELVEALSSNMSEKGIQNLESYIQTSLSDKRNITNTNSREFAVLATVLLEVQVKNGSEITNTASALGMIQNNPELPPEVRATAEKTKKEVEYAQFKRSDKIFEGIKKQKLAKTDQPQYSYKSA